MSGTALLDLPGDYNYPMRFGLILLIYLAGSGLGMLSISAASSLFLWNNIFQPLAFAKREGEFPVAYFVLVVLIVSYFVNLFRGKFRPIFGPYFWCVVVMVFWVFAATVASDYQKPAWAEFLRIIKYLLPLLCIYTAVNTTRDIRIIAGVLAGSVGIWAAQAGVHCLASGVSTDLGIPEGQLSDRNDFTAGIVGTLPILVYFARTYDWKFKLPARAVILLVIALGLIAIVYSNSRGASVGLALTLLVYVAFVSKNKFRDMLIGAVLIGGTLAILPASWWERMSTIEIGADQKEASAQQRFGLMMGALRATTDHPIFGLGPAGWFQVLDVYGDGVHNPHSIYLKLSAETGFVGLGIFLGIMAFTFVRVKNRVDAARRAKDNPNMWLGMALVMNVIGLLAAMTFLNSPFHEYLWAWVGLCHAYAQVYRPPALPRRAKAPRTGTGPRRPWTPTGQPPPPAPGPTGLPGPATIVPS